MIYFLIYVVGYVLAYISMKHYDCKIYKERWTKGLRLNALAISLFSWISFITTIWLILDETVGDNDASW